MANYEKALAIAPRMKGPALFVLGAAVGLMQQGLETGQTLSRSKDGIPAAVFFVFGGVAVLAAALDVRMIARGGVRGPSRLARHLWRMCMACFIAVMSFFAGQPQFFPEAVRKSGVLPIPGLVVLALLAFWLVRVKSRAPRPAASARPATVAVAIAT